MQIEQYIQEIALHAGIIIAFTQLVKIVGKDYIKDNFYPLISFVLGLLWGIFVANWSFVLAFMIGLVASGVYDLGKRTYKGITE